MVKAMSLEFNKVDFVHEGGDWRLELPDLGFGAEGVTCIVGPNGSGKSTLLRLAAGILRPLHGQVILAGRSLSVLTRKEIARGIGFLPQESIPLFDNTVEEVVEMGRYVHVRTSGVGGPEDRKAVDMAIDAVDAGGFRGRHLSCLSGGERRRALIASVIAQQPDVLLLDEPTSALDIHHAAEVMRVLCELGAAESGPAVVVVTHDINLASLFADRLVLMTGGRVCADGAPETVVVEDTMADAYGEALLVQQHPETGCPVVVPRLQAVKKSEVNP